MQDEKGTGAPVRTDVDLPTNEPSRTPAMIMVEPKARPKRSFTIGKLAAALAKAQGEIENAEKDVKGNYGKYATLASTWNAIRGALAKNEIAIFQRPLTIDGKLIMCTMLMHSSGEFLDDSELEMIYDKSGGRISPMQAMGSAVTYARRYTLQAALGVAPADDDDGEGAGKPQDPKPAARNSNPPAQQNKPAPAKNPPLKQPPPQNAPATKEQMETMLNHMIDRGVHENSVANLIAKGYGFKSDKPPQWVWSEIMVLLENEDCNDATIERKFQEVQRRRQAASAGGAQ